MTLSRAYAHDHGYVADAEDWPVVFADVLASDVWTDGNDPSEYGYAGPSLTGLHAYSEGEQLPPPDELPDETKVAVRESVDFTPSAGGAAERRVPPPLSAGTSRPRRPTPPR